MRIYSRVIVLAALNLAAALPCAAAAGSRQKERMRPPAPAVAASWKADANLRAVLETMDNKGVASVAHRMLLWVRETGGFVLCGAHLGSPSGHYNLTAQECDRDFDQPGPYVFIDPKVLHDRVSYPYVGALVAREVSELELSGFPDSAEKRFMVAARMAEVYVELGGDMRNAPKLGSVKDAAAAGPIMIWMESGLAAGVEAFKSLGHAGLDQHKSRVSAEMRRLSSERDDLVERLAAARSDLAATAAIASAILANSRAAAQAEKEFMALRAAEERFLRFQEEERDWIIAHAD